MTRQFSWWDPEAGRSHFLPQSPHWQTRGVDKASGCVRPAGWVAGPPGCGRRGPLLRGRLPALVVATGPRSGSAAQPPPARSLLGKATRAPFPPSRPPPGPSPAASRRAIRGSRRPWSPRGPSGPSRLCAPGSLARPPRGLEGQRPNRRRRPGSHVSRSCGRGGREGGRAGARPRGLPGAGRGPGAVRAGVAPGP